MSGLGDRPFGQTLYAKFTTVNASGVPTTLGNTPSLAYFVDNDTTLYTSGLTLTADYASKTGLNAIAAIVTTSCTGMVSGTDVQIVVAAGTVSGVSMIGYVVTEYSINKGSSLRPNTAGNNVAVNSSGSVAIDWGQVSNPTTTLGLSGTTIASLTNAPTSGDLTATMKTSVATAALTTQMTESYRANGAAPTLAQATFESLAHLGEASIVATTKTIKKIDHATTAETFTLNDATNPSSITRAT